MQEGRGGQAGSEGQFGSLKALWNVPEQGRRGPSPCRRNPGMPRRAPPSRGHLPSAPPAAGFRVSAVPSTSGGHQGAFLLFSIVAAPQDRLASKLHIASRRTNPGRSWGQADAHRGRRALGLGRSGYTCLLEETRTPAFSGPRPGALTTHAQVCAPARPHPRPPSSATAGTVPPAHVPGAGGLAGQVASGAPTRPRLVHSTSVY